MTDRSRIDVFVGSQVQLHRTLIKMSRAELAASVSIGEEQLAEYEAGCLRLPPDVLLSIADALGKRVSEFFRTVEQHDANDGASTSDKPHSRVQQEAALNVAFARLGDDERARVLAYVERLAELGK